MAGYELSFSKKAAIMPSYLYGNLVEKWKEHERIRKARSALYPKIKGKNSDFDNQRLKNHNESHYSYLDLKIALAQCLYQKCIYCERKCRVNRDVETGYCGVSETKIASEFMHMGEEKPLVPSHTIFFTGCTFNCVYCQNMDISSNPQQGLHYSCKKLAHIIDEKRRSGSFNVNFVGGDPTPHLFYILKTIRCVKENVPVVWNSNFYMSKEAMCLLDGIVDLYLTDFKYGNNECALRLSGIPDYGDVITRNHKIAVDAGDVIIRHLILPNHLECCTFPVFDWISENLGKKVLVNIMAQYRPLYGAFNHPDISRYPYKEEYLEAIKYARDLDLSLL